MYTRHQVRPSASPQRANERYNYTEGVCGKLARGEGKINREGENVKHGKNYALDRKWKKAYI